MQAVTADSLTGMSDTWTESVTQIGETTSDQLESMRTELSSAGDDFGEVWNASLLRMSASTSDQMQQVEDTISSSISSITGQFASTQLSFNQHVDIPHFSMSGRFDAQSGEVPSVGVSWYKKAMNQPYLFTDATLFGAGEAGDEMMYGRDSLMRDIRQATSGQASVTINMTVNGAEGQDVRKLADEVVDRINQKMREQKAVYA